MIDLVIGFANTRNIKYKVNINLAQISTVRIGPIAPIMLFPDQNSSFVDLVGFLELNLIRYIVVGSLSNTLILGDSFAGVIISLKLLSDISIENNMLCVGAGALLSASISTAANHSLGGLEPLRWIPGTVGAAISGNAGAGGLEVSDRLLSALVYSKEMRELKSVFAEDVAPTYRGTALKSRGDLVLSASFLLVERDKDEITRDFNEARRARLANQPFNQPSLGSVFKRYKGVGAGYYIDRAGLKGTKIGSAKVSEKHAGFFVNLGGATASEYLELIELVKSRVYDAFGILLEEEIVIVK